MPTTGQPETGKPETGQPEPGQPERGQPEPGQPAPGQPAPGQPAPGQPAPGQHWPGKSAQGPARTLTLRVPRPRMPKLSQPVALARADDDRPAGRVGEAAGRGFAMLTVLPVIVVVGWLLPGLPLLLAGEFAPVPMVLIAAPLVTALAVNLLHRIPGQWPTDLPGRARGRAWHGWSGIFGMVAVSGGFTAWQLAKNSPSVLPTRRPGAAFQTGYWIAQHGSLPIPGSLGAFGGPHPGLHLSSIGFVEHGHAIVAAVTAGLPMLLAGGFWTSGTGGGTVIAPLLGGLAVLSFGGLVGRLAGRQWAPAGALVLALTLPEFYASRDAFSETAVQILLFGGLSLVIDALTIAGPSPQGAAAGPSRQGADAPSGPLPETAQKAPSPEGAPTVLSPATAQTAPLPAIGGPPRRLVSRARAVARRDLPSRVARSLTPEVVLGAFGGLALGLTSLLSLASLAYLVPVIAVAGIVLMARRSAGVAFCIGMFVGTGYGIAAGHLLAQPPTGPWARPVDVIELDAGAVLLLMVAVLLLMRVPRARRLVRGVLERRPLRWLPGLGGVAVVAAIGWLAARPYLQIVRGSLGRAQADYIAMLQRMAGLRVDPTRLYYEDTLYWVIWYAGIATVLLGGFGAAVLVRRCLRALLTWRDSSGTGLNWALPLAVTLGGSAAVLWQPFTVPDQPWASRRLVPVVIPGLILLAAWAAAWLTRKARERGAGTTTAAIVGAFCVGAMLLPSISTSFGFGLTHAGTRGGLRPTAGGLAQHRVGAHEAEAVRGLCSALGQSSSVVIVDRRVAQVFSQVVRGMCGVPVAWVPPGAPPTVIDAVLRGIARAGRRPVVLGARPSQVGAFGGSPMLIVNLATTQYPHELTQPAGAPWRVRYVIWMASVGAPNAGI